LPKKDKDAEYLQNLLNSTIEMWGAMAGNIVAEVVEKYGDEGRKIVKKASYEVGKWQAERIAKKLILKDKGAKTLAKYGYPTEGAVVGDNAVFRLEHARLNDKRFDLKVNFCPYVDTWRKLGILKRVPDLCDLLTEGDNGVSVVFAPNLRMTLTKAMSRGDAYCIYSWKEERSLKKTVPTSGTKSKKP
jgi:hypothetical protein